MSQISPDSKVVKYPGDVARFPRQPREEEGSESFDLRELFMKLWVGRWTIILCVIVFMVLAFVAVSQLKPVYRASTTVMFGIQRPNIVPDMLDRSEFSTVTLENEIQVLRSQNLIERVVRDLDLVNDPEFNTMIAQPSPGLAERTGISVTLPGSVTALLETYGLIAEPEAPLSPEEAERQGYITAVNSVRENLTLTPVRDTQVISIGFSSYDPETAAKVVQTIANQYIVDQLQAKLDTTRSASEWLSARVSELRDKVQVSEEAVETLRAELSIAAGQSIETTQQQLADLNKALSVARTRTAEVASRFEGLTLAMDSGTDLSVESPLFREYRETEADLVASRDALSANHPNRARLNLQIEDVRQRMSEEAARIRSTLEVELASARSQEESLRNSVRELETKVMNQSRQEIELHQLEREADANRLIYQSMLGRMNEVAEQESLQNADARILSPAQAPLQPESSLKVTALALAGTLGALVGVILVFMFDHLNNTFRIAQQIEELTGETVLGTIPLIGSRTNRRDVVRDFLDKPASSLAESIRNLRTSILLSNVDNPPKVVLFTSSVPGEGKSTTALLTAITSRQMGKSAIIVDCDLRLPSVAKLMKSNDHKAGLLSVLEGTATLQDAVIKHPDTGLHMLMSHPRERNIHVNAADILSSQRFRDLLKSLREQYDLVVLDAPPALIVTDARVMSLMVDSVVYLVRWNSTPRSAVFEGLRELQSIQAPISGIAMTLVNEAKASEYILKGHSYHKGRYTNYYSS